MSLAPVIALLRQRIGLEPGSLGATTLSRSVTSRMRALGLSTGKDYAARLACDMEEFQLLLADVAVPETWFFRGGQVFMHLARQVAGAIGQCEQKETYRILSVPCSTGEEPYSLAIALAESGVPAASWEIVAVDICSRHLEVARRGRFGNFSFRQTPSLLRDRYFHAVAEGWELDPAIRARVRFHQANLVDPLFLADEGSFNLILCRNLFIYLTPDARRQALNAIMRLLAVDGWLCTGHADPVEFENSRFQRIGPRSYFLYRRIAEGPDLVQDEQAASCRSEKIVKRKLPATTPPPRHHRTARLEPRLALASGEPPVPIDLLVQARRQADSGRLADALASCQDQLARAGPSADLYSLMGVIHQARQENDQAVRCYERALYLEREHTEALTQLMLLSQEQGDHVQAGRLRRRLARIPPGGRR